MQFNIHPCPNRCGKMASTTRFCDTCQKYEDRIETMKTDIASARDWLTPQREVYKVEIDNCVKELNDILERKK